MPQNSNSNLILNVVNNTSTPQNAVLFTNTDVATSPNTQNYTWNVTSFSFLGEQTVSIQEKLIGANSFTTLNAPISTLTFQGVCDALNTLGIGTFSTYTNGGNTYITVYTLTYVFGSLDMFNNVNILSLTFDNIANVPVSNPNSVSDWNTYFNTAIYADVPFYSVTVVGNTVNLIGGVNFALNNTNSSSHIVSITDNYTVTSIIGSNGNIYLTSLSLPNCKSIGLDNNDGIGGCQALTSAYLPLVTAIGDYAMSLLFSLTNISLPSLLTTGDFAFYQAVAVTTIYLPVCTALGSTTGDNSVFDLIVGNTITLTIPLATSTDGDVAYLQANNTVTLITT